MTTFNVVAASDRVPLDSSRHGRASFKATNTTSRQVRGQARVVTIGDSRPDWFSLEGDSQRLFAASATLQFDVAVELPAGASGEHKFRMSVVGIEVPDEDYGQSEPVSVTLAAAPAPPPKSKGYVTTFVGALAGALVGLLVGTLPGSIVLISAVHQTFTTNPNASIGEAIAQAFLQTLIVAIIGAALLIIGSLVGLWIGPVIGAYVALRARAHPYVGLTTGLLAVIQPILIVLLGLLAIVIFNSVKQANPQLAILIAFALVDIVVGPWLARGATRLIKLRKL
jgi:hypothetical protein